VTTNPRCSIALAPPLTIDEQVAAMHDDLAGTLDRCLIERDKVVIEMIAALTTADRNTLRINLKRIDDDIAIARASVKAFRSIFGLTP
jgi:hypothetical protein